MIIAVCILGILVISLSSYVIFVQLQLRSINKQLTKRIKENTHQPISLALINKELNILAININKCLKAEENLRLNIIGEEKHFREMIANISHDLRTPLTAIKGYQQLMKKGGLSEEQMEKLIIAQKHADELGRLIEHFFEYSYLVNLEPELQKEKINLTNLVAECLAEAISTFEERNLSVKFCDVLPVFALVDKEMTLRIIRNLIRNSIQHSNNDIEVRVFTDNNAIISFSNFVSNTSEMDVKRIFDRFYVADKAREKTGGLGLAIVKLLANQMGGRTEATLVDGIFKIVVELPKYEKEFL